jgi:hypothetical protein
LTFNAETLVGRVKGAAYFRSHDCKKPGTKIYQIYETSYVNTKMECPPPQLALSTFGGLAC